MQQHIATNREALTLKAGDPVDHIQRSNPGQDLVDEFYPVGHFTPETLRRTVAPDAVEYMGRWRIASIQIESEAGGQQRAIVEIEPF
jgi:hypothetical protein